ncbi:hypothetical protein CLOBOL_02870 [Enterocloster bolteae ATCC BAA-613]|uniref:Uncharacterized protein n=1 Tax=Enterocloster bolteae (strain ATCC BAA-613 / DSM 15670 / CCUG 46953 / JCM 12243 / WAL 16351) TaxID=411902 RepID=A8RQY9_ENTBW|nr:hypothetical protein CLOBOL_02870 [Enterocloster bolteae ATCC BAA-613]
MFRFFDMRDDSVWYQAWAPELPGGGLGAPPSAAL